jgi:hypothetical protein
MFLCKGHYPYQGSGLFWLKPELMAFIIQPHTLAPPKSPPSLPCRAPVSRQFARRTSGVGSPIITHGGRSYGNHYTQTHLAGNRLCPATQHNRRRKGRSTHPRYHPGFQEHVARRGKNRTLSATGKARTQSGSLESERYQGTNREPTGIGTLMKNPAAIKRSLHVAKRPG